ncbi:hypothetical protein VitviT2T_027305 [Vitis vinifera]|nr:uncharacterized protein LOC100854825 [Vitis vinifera]WKA09682.1 hypothetical protein VitviT2T_027305 [Vitis vinifera]CAN74009.1 hypothetical protein VITISV_003546 [Vitis vinifera]|eukprot:XP_010664378.2 PREDICTED: uncharacterized protein LOC100854825 [Vitis vinifera]
MAMELVSGFHAKLHDPVNLLHGIKPAADTQLLVTRFPDSGLFLKVVGRSLLISLVILSIPLFGSILGGSSPSEPDSTNVELLPVLFHDLMNEGLLKMGDKSLFVSGASDQAAYESRVISDNKMDLISVSDFERQSSIPEATVDFAFVHDFSATATFIDRTLKIGGIAVVQLSNDASVAFDKPSNYRIVYLRRFDSTVVAMRKTDHTQTNSRTQRRLCGLSSEAKKAALKNLEDVLLEPPRAASRKSSSYLKRTKYLPDLTGDSLESYPRRVFIHVGPPETDEGKNVRWFASHYPTRNRDFEMYKIETTTEESKGKEEAELGMSEWLRKNVKEEEYVVMKAEAEVVEEMVKSKAIGLVDELFLECKPQSLNNRKSNTGGRAYWECLALYGQLRDEGVAVHQWWS